MVILMHLTGRNHIELTSISIKNYENVVDEIKVNFNVQCNS